MQPWVKKTLPKCLTIVNRAGQIRKLLVVILHIV